MAESFLREEPGRSVDLGLGVTRTDGQVRGERSDDVISGPRDGELGN